MIIKLIKNVKVEGATLLSGTQLINYDGGLPGYFKYDDNNNNTIYQLHESDYEVEEYDELQ